MDYRHFDSKGIQPLYEFGFGLSYTTFRYSNFVIVGANQSMIHYIKYCCILIVYSTLWPWKWHYQVDYSQSNNNQQWNSCRKGGGSIIHCISCYCWRASSSPSWFPEGKKFTKNNVSQFHIHALIRLTWQSMPQQQSHLNWMEWIFQSGIPHQRHGKWCQAHTLSMLQLVVVIFVNPLPLLSLDHMLEGIFQV